MRRKSHHYYRHPETTQEARYSHDEDHKPFVRAKRRAANLPNAYDDQPYTYTKSWKDKRKTQYREANTRLVCHTYTIDDTTMLDGYIRCYNFEKYCEAHNIPYKVVRLYEPYKVRNVQKYKRVVWYTTPKYIDHYHKDGTVTQHQSGYRTIYRDIPLDKPIVTWYTGKRRIGFKVTWWSPKDKNVRPPL